MTRKIVKSNLKEALLKRGMDNKTLHKISKVREATIGEMANDENKNFSRDNLNAIISALDIKDIKELISIIEVKDEDNKNNR